MEEYRCAPGVRRKCPDSDGPGCTYSPGGKCEADNMAYLPPTMRQTLAEYRASGLEPEAVAQLKQIADIFNCDFNDPAQLKGLLDELRGWQQVGRDGRLVVLPCKVGDAVYHVVHPRTCAPVIVEHRIETLGEAASLVGRMGKGVLIDTYLTRQEAEAAVERLKGEGAK